MSKDEEALLVLQNIEKLLKKATMLSNTKEPFSARAQQLSQKERADKEMRKSFKAIASSGKETNDALLGLNKSLVTLNTEVGKTATGFGSLNVQMAKFMSSLQPVQSEDAVGQAGLVKLDDANLVNAMNLLGVRTTAAVDKLAQNLQNVSKTQPAQENNGFALLRANKPKAETTKPIPKDLDETKIPLRDSLKRMTKNFGSLTVTTGGLTVVMGQFYDVAVKVAKDFFTLSAVGMGTAQSLGDVYKYAILAGMGLKDYMDVIQRANLVAARAGNLENFNKIVSAQDNQLAAMGIFGSTARQLQADLAQSNASMGIRLNELTKTAADQISIFDELRKSSNMTAEQFAKMVDVVADSEQAQRELNGLAPRERSARMQELLQLQTVGSRLGMTAEASMALGKALIEQRKATVKDRFSQGAAILQMGAFTGNGAAAQRAFELNMKGRNRSSAEDKELFAIVQQMTRAGDTMYENGALGVQNALDTLQENIEKGSLGELVKQGRTASLAKDAGPMQQEAFGKHVNEFGQWVGKLTAIGNGISQSIAGPLLTALSAGIAYIARGPLMAVISKMIPSGGGAAAETGGVLSALAKPLVAVKDAGSSFLNWIKNVPVLFGNAVGVIQNTMTGVSAFVRNASNALKFTNWLSGPVDTMKFLLQESGVKLAQGARAAATSVNAGANSLFAGLTKTLGRFPVIGGLIDAAFEGITGQISDALNPSGGWFNRIGGMVTAFFTAIPRFIIETMAFVFGENALQPIRNGFDIFVAYVNMAIKHFMSNMVGGITWVLEKILPDDSKLVAGLKSMQTGLENSAMENAVAVEKLWGDQSKTLSSISKENQKSAEAQAKTTNQATAKVNQSQQKFANVMSANGVSAAQAIQDAKSFNASPMVEVPKTVSPTNVNNEQQPGQSSPYTSPMVAPDPEMLTVLNAILQTLKDSLTAESKQVENSEALIGLLKPRRAFESSEQTASRYLKRD